ncbi:MAG: hypothetical protein RBR67_07280 [Desulfobacterium sp.]|jgi:hypothetical protein|nr:hypothetical protein [Desulfobacterium sp.]
MVGNIHQTGIDQKIVQYNQIGGNHLKDDLSQRTSTWLGRAFSQLFSKDSNNQAVLNLIKEIRTMTDSDRYAGIATAKLRGLVEMGKPLTGRVAAQVLSEIKTPWSEDRAIKVNIRMNIDGYVQDMAEQAFEDEQSGIDLNLLTKEGKKVIKEEAKVRLKSRFTENFPSKTQMKEEIIPVAREHCRVKITGSRSALEIRASAESEYLEINSVVRMPRDTAGEVRSIRSHPAHSPYNQNKTNAEAKAMVENILTHLDPPTPKAYQGDPSFPITGSLMHPSKMNNADSFMHNFFSTGVVVNGEEFGGIGPWARLDNETANNELQRFADAFGWGKERGSGFHGNNVQKAWSAVNLQGRGPGDEREIIKGVSRSITFDNDKNRVFINLKHNMGDLDQVKYSSEVKIMLSDLNGDVQVTDIETAITFTT